MKFRNIAALIATAGLGLGLLGAGVGAQFSQSGSVKESINMGSFGCSVTSTSPGVTVSGNTVTFATSTIEASTGQSPVGSFTLANTGTMPVVATWTVTEPSSNNTDINVNTLSPAITTGSTVVLGTNALNNSETYTNVGFNWSNLSNADLTAGGATVTYQVSCQDDTALYTCPNIPVVLSANNGGSAVWANGQCKEIDLTLGTDTVPSTNFAMADFGNLGALPATAPTFVTDNYNSSSPRLTVIFTDGTYVWEFPSNAGLGSDNWSTPGNGADVSYSSIVTSFGNKTVADVWIIADGDQTNGTVDRITCLNYSGDLFGSC